MIRWRVVAVGVVSALLVESIGYAVAGRLSLLGGLLGSALAGWLVGDDAARGARYGLAVGLAWGVVLAPVAIYLSLATGEVALAPYEHVTPNLGLGANAVVLAVGLTVPNALVGGLGATFRTVYTATRTNRRHG